MSSRDDARRRARAQHLAASRQAETRYVLDLRRILAQVHAGVLTVVRREGLIPGAEKRQDAPRSSLGLGDALVSRIVKYVRPEVGRSFDRMSGVVLKSSAEGAKKIGLIAISPGSAKLTAAVAAARDKNIRLVEDAGRAYAKDVRDVIGDPDNFGMRPEALADLLEERGGVSASRAALIARDQTLKLNGQLVEVRARASGLHFYEWSTSRDERVRKGHAELEGQRFSWDDPPETNDDGDRNHPGQDYQCRCIPAPVFEDEDESAAPADEDVAAE